MSTDGIEQLLSLSGDRCPVCNTPGKKIRPETLRSLVKGDRMPVKPDGYSLCLSPRCSVIYFGDQIFYKEDVKVKVWYKEGPEVPVCYCKNVTVNDIFDHITRGCCRDLKDLQAHTGVNTGKDCLTKNPAGT